MILSHNSIISTSSSSKSFTSIWIWNKFTVVKSFQHYTQTQYRVSRAGWSREVWFSSNKYIGSHWSFIISFSLSLNKSDFVWYDGPHVDEHCSLNNPSLLQFKQIMDTQFMSFDATVNVTSFETLSACIFSWLEEYCKPQVWFTECIVWFYRTGRSCSKQH